MENHCRNEGQINPRLLRREFEHSLGSRREVYPQFEEKDRKPISTRVLISYGEFAIK